MSKLRRVLAVVAVPVAVSVTPAANAAGVLDVSAAVGTLTSEGIPAIVAIGGAMLGLAAIAVVFKWAKASFFG